MTENIRKLLELASSNEELKNKLSNADKDTLISIAKENGIVLIDADFEQTDEIADDELNTVVGGKSCYCFSGGGGTGEGDDKTCACVFGGVGKDYEGKKRCMCVMMGDGNG